MVRIIAWRALCTSYSPYATRREMRKRLNPCFTVSVRPKPPSWASEHEQTVDPDADAEAMPVPGPAVSGLW